MLLVRWFYRLPFLVRLLVITTTLTFAGSASNIPGREWLILPLTFAILAAPDLLRSRAALRAMHAALGWRRTLLVFSLPLPLVLCLFAGSWLFLWQGRSILDVFGGVFLSFFVGLALTVVVDRALFPNLCDDPTVRAFLLKHVSESKAPAPRPRRPLLAAALQAIPLLAPVIASPPLSQIVFRSAAGPEEWLGAALMLVALLAPWVWGVGYLYLGNWGFWLVAMVAGIGLPGLVDRFFPSVSPQVAIVPLVGLMAIDAWRLARARNERIAPAPPGAPPPATTPNALDPR